MLTKRWVLFAVLVVLAMPAVGQTAEEARAAVGALLAGMAEDTATGLLLIRLSVDAVASGMALHHLEQIEALLIGAEEEAAARFGWPREPIHGLANDAAELARQVQRLPLDAAVRQELSVITRNIQALLALTLDEIRLARRQRPADRRAESLLRASAFLVATLGLPINAYPDGIYTIAWRLEMRGLLEGIEPLWRPDPGEKDVP
jgi:hypothetical protein